MEKAKTTNPKPTTEDKVAYVGTKPNLLGLLDPKKKIKVISDRGDFLDETLENYTLPAGTEEFVHISPVESYHPKHIGSVREPVRQILLNTFALNPVLNVLQHPTERGAIPFQLPETLADRALQGFLILRACTEAKKDKEGTVVFTEDAKALVGQRFDLKSQAEIVRKCQELRMLNWGNMKCYVDDILHFPGFNGNTKIDEWCMPDTENVVGKNIPVLPD